MNGANAVQPHDEPAGLKSVDPLRELAGKIFSRADWDYVAKEPGPVRRLFKKERRALAFQWLTQIRRRVSLMMDYHHELEKDDYRLKKIELLKLYHNYIFFLSLHVVLSGLIRWANPIYGANLADRVLALVDRFSEYIPPPTRLF
jgi:hypothetical protein